MQPGMRFVATLVLSALVMSSCTTIDPFTREEKTSNTAKGAAVGAAVGAAGGAIAGRDLKSAAIGAGIGALAGGAVGAYMDQQEAKLRQQLEGTGVSVTRVGDNIILNMPGNITFATNSSNLNPAFHEVLDSVALVLDEYEKTVVEAAGHTDSTGDESYNQALSEQRAQAVSRYLVTEGVQPVRIAAYGYGESRPVASNATPGGRQQNRRVELTLLPVTQ
ncbi:MAG: OmpA family protein [Gammaproteobacteria bacterium]|nr:OmpA family protein [Gammaproteobacteria bacterium]NIR83694.1 OmpA family protein [Gammaproteobacteria bacterium]NIR91669.1 OmpA family protein [Gammaproteobacteria bacterium]NIU04856.1 OmpA family protein [Gammaproteobacteria bacterium]NIV51842.1 OmpA family protein [Gammaproteobacteria bacterium]